MSLPLYRGRWKRLLGSGLSSSTSVMCGSKLRGYPKTDSAGGSVRLLRTPLYNDSFLCMVILKLLKPSEKNHVTCQRPV